jgi:hypothetical protein
VVLRVLCGRSPICRISSRRRLTSLSAATTKGTALAAADVIEVIDVPAGTMVLNAGLQVITVATGESNDTTVDLGITTTDPDCFVDGFDLDAAAAGAYAQNAAAFQPLIVVPPLTPSTCSSPLPPLPRQAALCVCGLCCATLVPSLPRALLTATSSKLV